MRMGVRRRLTCCTRDREISIDFDEKQHDRIMTYDGLESCILNSQYYRNGSIISREDEFPTDSFNEEGTSCSSSKDAFGSLFSDRTTNRNHEETDEWSGPESPEHIYVREKPAVYTTQFADMETMKEKFAKLLLGEDVTGGRKGISSALAISNAITNLAASVFGELWKLEPLSEERRAKWSKEMDWFLSPANYMVELVPAKQNGANGRNFEIMTPKARGDVHINIPALQKIDSMLIEFLDSMVKTEFWYSEGNSRKDGRGQCTIRQSKRWWLPSPRVPAGGLSETARKKLLSQGNRIHQVFKAAKSINENVLLEMPVPKDIQDTLPKSGRASLGEELYKIIASGSCSTSEIINCLKLRSEHEVLDTINKLETAALVWRERNKEQVNEFKTPVKTSWSFMKEPSHEMVKAEALLVRVDALLCQLKMRYPCLPHTFLNVTKIQYGKDIGHSILEAYSRVLGNLAYSILSRIGEILQEDHMSNPNSPVPTIYFSPASSINGSLVDSPIVNPRVRHSLVERMNKVDGYFSDSNPSRSSDSEISSSTDPKSSSVTATPSSSRIWCTGKDPCYKSSPDSSFR